VAILCSPKIPLNMPGYACGGSEYIASRLYMCMLYTEMTWRGIVRYGHEQRRATGKAQSPTVDDLVLYTCTPSCDTHVSKI